MKTIFEIREIKTGSTMYVSLHNSTAKEVKQFIAFYRSFKEFGMFKYKII